MDRKKQFHDMIINRMIFTLKFTDPETVEIMRNTNFDELMMIYITTIPLPKTVKECNNQLALIRKYALKLIDFRTFARREQNPAYRKLIEAFIVGMNARLDEICRIYDQEDLPLHDFCQLLGINYKVAKLNIRDEEEPEVNHYHYIFNGIEDAREDKWMKYNRNGMPLFELVHANFMIMYDQNKEIKDQVDNFVMYDMGLAEHMVTIKEDNSGNQVVEKYYPPLKMM